MVRLLVFGMGSYTGGGVVNYIMNQVRAFDKTRIHVDFIYHYKSGRIAYEEEITSSGSKVFYLPERRDWKAFCREHYGEYDLIIFHTSNPIFLPLMLLRKKSGIKTIIIHSHCASYSMPWYMTMFTPLTGFYLKQKMHYLKVRKWAVSEPAGHFMFKKGDDFEIVLNSVDVNHYKFDSEERLRIRKELGINDDTIAVGMVGRVDPIKNIPFGLRAFSKYHEINHNSHFFLVGGVSMDYEMDKIRNTVNALSINDCFTNLGNRDDISAVYSALDVLLFPSRAEGFGLTGLEAQISGLPCVVSDKVPAIIRIGNLAKFLPISENESNYESWADTIIQMLKLENDRAERYKDAIKAGFDTESSIKRVENLLMDYCNS